MVRHIPVAVTFMVEVRDDDADKLAVENRVENLVTSAMATTEVCNPFYTFLGVERVQAYKERSKVET